MKFVLAAAAATVALAGIASAAPMTIGGVNFDSSNGVVEAKLAAGGSFKGLTPGADVNGIEGFKIGQSGPNGLNEFELINNGTADDDVLSLLFANPIVNGAGSCVASPNDGENGPASAADYAGCDLIVFEVFNQSDSPTVALTLAAAMLPDQPSPPSSILGVLLSFLEFDVDGDGDLDGLTIWGFDLTGLNIAVGAAATNPLFLGRDKGTPDIGAVVGLNFGAPPPVIPVPAALPLFLAGLAGMGFAARRKAAK
ncbi:MAG: hypothetical protein HXY23_04865 [Parvularculaceae bacterium]|nr:hypothetical protein [Parvularculaceae bacterium]